MNRFYSLFILMGAAAAVPVFGQGLSSSSTTSGSTTTTTGSVYVSPPSSTNGQNAPASAGDAATQAIPSAVRAKADAAHASWLAQIGAEFYPKYTYAGGAPILMLMVPADEMPSVQARRRKAMVQACEFMMADDTFDRAIICIATYDRKDRLSMSTHNTTITRDAFHAAAQKAGNSPDLVAAFNAVYHSSGAVDKICADLGLR